MILWFVDMDFRNAYWALVKELGSSYQDKDNTVLIIDPGSGSLS